MKQRALISTHDLDRAGALRDAFRNQGFQVDLVTAQEAMDPQEETALLVLTGALVPGDEPELLRQARARTDLAVMAFLDPDAPPPSELPSGVSELFSPEASADEVVLVARRLLGRHRLQEATGIVGETDAMREVMERVVQIAPVASTVLITGESGTGKELVARGIHALSPRRHKPFMAVNVAAITESLLESELFGHEKGAFTGAIDARRGFFELAHGGTIFLDEIGEMPLATQTKLLRVLEEREFLRVGGEKPIRVDVRIIAATNQDLRQMVALREFRKDLYYRLNVLHIELPPLRERRPDVPILIRRFIQEISERHDRPFVGISPEAMTILREYHWPGNIRELRNLVESMVILAPGREILPSDIPREVRAPESTRGSLLPAPIPRGAPGDAGEAGLRPQLEFIFRTLVDLRVDMDDLKKEFDEYRAGIPGIRPPVDVGVYLGRGAGAEIVRHHGLGDADILEVGEESHSGLSPLPEGEPEPQEKGVVVYRPGMTMEEMEREAIAAALAQVEGNRRKAAELLGIGERTLYRKIRKFGLDT
ncbi:MAG TPA: sigma-54 dependent transcriptional regulator [Longimicrobiales bacterium]|nr:sigma-54 dependent transcriptional regulator [Longimicrobiales bacterium]